MYTFRTCSTSRLNNLRKKKRKKIVLSDENINNIIMMVRYTFYLRPPGRHARVLPTRGNVRVFVFTRTRRLCHHLRSGVRKIIVFCFFFFLCRPIITHNYNLSIYLINLSIYRVRTTVSR